LRFLFEDYVLDDARHELRKGAKLVSIEARIFELLAFLIRNRERVVSQDDLRISVWEGRFISVSTISSSMNAARAAVGDSGDAQRVIRTVPRKGYRFIAPVVEEQAVPEQTAETLTSTQDLPLAAGGKLPAPVEHKTSGELIPLAKPGQAGENLELAETTPGQRSATLIIAPGRRRTSAGFAAGLGAGLIAALLLYAFWPPQNATRTAPGLRPTKEFDAAAVPLVDETERRGLASYASRPDFKAVAISDSGVVQVFAGAVDAESAKQGALQGCTGRSQRPCAIYAVGKDVVWLDETLPLPAESDLRLDPLEFQFIPSDIPMVGASVRRQIARDYPKSSAYKAVAVATGHVYWTASKSTKAEVIRLAIERCGYRFQRPCLILAVDEFLTIRIPKTRKITGIFLPSADVDPEGRENISHIYQGPEWRALARGQSGGWHPIAGAPSEPDAIEAAIKSCMQVDRECRLYAIGNFRVADE
jgi:DNA-binding winged helix-turn-helix (wHTH) protein